VAVYKRGETWWIRFQHHGTEVRESARTHSKTEAKAFERKRREEIADGYSTTKPKTYGQALVKWIESGAPKSLLSHANNTRPYLEHIQLSKVPPAAHDMQAAMLAAGLSPQTVNRRLAVVRRILNLAYKKWNWLDRPLGEKIQLSSEKGMDRHIYLSRDEVRSLVGAMKAPEAAAGPFSRRTRGLGVGS
jgi:hypothetical protein